MADILDVITSRTSIRYYTDKPVPDEMIDKMIEAGRRAPSGENEQPWRLIIVRDKEMIKNISDWCKVGTGQRFTAEHCLGQDTRIDTDERKKELYTGEVSNIPVRAPLVIVVIGEIKGMMDTPYDLSACIENMLLEAHSLGLGAVWIHGPAVYPRIVRKLKEMLSIPTGMADYKMLAVVPVGWPLRQRRYPRPRKESLEFVYWGRFGNKERNR